MKKILFAAIVLISSLGSFSQSNQNTKSTSNPKKWNVLSIVLEDMSCKLAAYGDSTIKTPNIDRLAKEGIVFDNAYACAGVCAPSRSAIITGMFPVAIGSQHMRIATDPKTNKYNVPLYEVVPPPSVKCFTEYLRMAGVYCENQDKTDYQFTAPATAWDATKKLPEHQKPELYKDFPSQQPFYKVMNFWQTHESQLIPGTQWSMRNFEKIAFDSSKIVVPPYLPNTAPTRADIAHQYNHLQAIDRHVGAILDGLQEQGLLDNTLILFYTDHGDGLPRAKRTVYESGVKVPLIVRFPDKRMAGTRNNDFVYLMDIGPTIMSMYGISIPGYMHGQDFLFDQKPNNKRAYLFFSADRFDAKYDFIRAIRHENFKYIRNFQPQKPQFLELEFRANMGSVKELYRLDAANMLTPAQQTVMRKTKPVEELYDLSKDPYEIENLADKPQYAGILRKMRAALDSFQIATKDMGFLPEQEMAQMFWPGGVQPKTAEPVFKKEGKKGIISCDTEGASIGYKLHPSQAWTIYTGPFDLPAKTDSIEIMAHRIGFLPADIKKIKVK